MPQGDKSSYTDKQKRQAAHIEAGYENKGVSVKNAEARAWATVNKLSGGGKKGGSGRKKKLKRKNMQTGTKTPMAVPSSGGRKILVLGHELTLKLTCRETDGEYFVFEAVTPPGVGMALHVHRHEDEFLRVLEGEFEFQLDQQIQKVTPGAMVVFPKNIPHAFRNVGTKPGRTFWTVMPGATLRSSLKSWVLFQPIGSQIWEKSRKSSTDTTLQSCRRSKCPSLFTYPPP